MPSGAAPCWFRSSQFSQAPQAAKNPSGGNPDAGRELAVDACTGCTLNVAARGVMLSLMISGFYHFWRGFRAFVKLLTGRPPRRHIAAMPQVPQKARMANPLLTDGQLAERARRLGRHGKRRNGEAQASSPVRPEDHGRLRPLVLLSGAVPLRQSGLAYPAVDPTGLPAP